MNCTEQQRCWDYLTEYRAKLFAQVIDSMGTDNPISGFLLQEAEREIERVFRKQMQLVNYLGLKGWAVLALRSDLLNSRRAWLAAIDLLRSLLNP